LRNRFNRSCAVAAIALALLSMACQPPTTKAVSGDTVGLYAVSNMTGKIYEIVTSASPAKAAATSLVTVPGSNANEMVIKNGIAFVSVGNTGSNACGLYYFAVANPGAGCTKMAISGSTASISAQSICIASSTVGYVTSADYTGTFPNALYSFNPSKPSAGLSLVCALSFPQGVAVGADGYVYVAENGAGKVARVNPAAKTYTEIACTEAGATGLLAGSYNGTAGVFVANTGTWNTSTSSYGNGSVDFIASSGSTATSVYTSSSFTAAGLASLSSNCLVTTAYGHSYRVALGSTPTATEVLSGTTSFGNYDVKVLGGLAYVPDGGNKSGNTIYCFSARSSPVAVAVGVKGDGVGHLCFAE
jgi:hypothetical protein